MLGAMIRGATGEARATAREPAEWMFESLGGGARTSTGERITDAKALGLPAVRRGVAVTAMRFAALPMVVYRRIGESGKEADKSHPAYPLLMHQWNPELTAYVAKLLTMTWAILRGNAYAYVFRNRDGEPERIVPLDAPTWPVRENGRLWYLTDTGTELRRLDPVNVLHVRGLGLSPLAGLGLMDSETGRDSLALAAALQKYSAKFFGNDALPPAVLTTDADLSPEQAIELKRGWESWHKGLDRAHSVGVLTNGGKIQQLGIDAEKAQLIEAKKMSLTDVANLVHLPPHKVGAEGKSAFASLEQENRSIWDDNLGPWACNWSQELRRRMLTTEQMRSDSHTILVRRIPLLEADAATVSQTLRAEVNDGLLTPDEARGILDRGPQPDGVGDRYRMPHNTAVIGESGLPEFSQPKQQALDSGQIAAIGDTLAKVGDGSMDPEVAKLLLETGFPAVPAERIAEMVDAVEIEEPEPVPVQLEPDQPPGLPAPEPEEEDAEPPVPPPNRAALEALLVRDLRRAISRAGFLAEKAAKKSPTFPEFLEGLPNLRGELAGLLEAPLALLSDEPQRAALSTAEAILGDLRGLWTRIYDTATPESFPGAIQAAWKGLADDAPLRARETTPWNDDSAD